MLTPFRYTEASSRISIPRASPQNPARSRMFQRRVGAVGVDRLEALRLHLETGEAGIARQPGGDLAHQVLDEPRALVRPLGGVVLVRALEQRIEVAGGR